MALEFRCRPAPSNETNVLITIAFLGLRQAFLRAKTRFSAVDSGIIGAPARLRSVARDRGNAQLQALVAELKTKARRQTRRPKTLAAGV
jgi:hypothetical protein